MFYAPNYLTTTGRLDLRNFRKQIKSVDREDFIHQLPQPFLVSAALLEGNMKKQAASAGNTNTVIFSAAAIRAGKLPPQVEEDNFDDISASSIFYLVKNPANPLVNPSTFTIGRVQPNDLVMPDYTVSRKHSQILWRDNNLYLLDLGSTNGTLLASSSLEREIPAKLQIRSRIGIGRLEFILLDAGSVYDLIKQRI